MKLGAFLMTAICMNVAVVNAQVPGGIRVPDGVGPLLIGFEENVYRGEKNLIKLSKGNKGERGKLEYSLFDEPAHGKLDLDPQTGDATYSTNDPLKAGVVEDHFEFRVRDDKGNFSAAVEVRLKIVGRVAVLEVPETVDFGEVVMGGAMDRELLLENKGDGGFFGEVLLPEGFMIGEKRKVELEIPAQARKALLIRFLGRENFGQGREVLRLKGNSLARRVNLTYEVKPPFQVQDKITLEFDDDSHARSARLRINNPFEAGVIINLRLPRGLNADETDYEIAAQSARFIDLNIPSHDADQFDGTIIIEEKRFRKEVKVVAKASPSRVVVVGMPQGKELFFEGLLSEDPDVRPRGLMQNIQLSNVGGQSANVSMITNPPFFISVKNNPHKLGPGQSLMVRVELRADKVGMVEDLLRIDYAGDPLAVKLRGNVLLPKGITKEDLVPPPEWREKKVQRDPGLGGVRFSDLAYGKNKRRSSPAVPAVKAIRIIEQRSSSLLIGWRAPAGSDWDYELDALVRLKDEETGLPVPTWVKIGPEHLTLTKKGSDVRAEILGISPGRIFQFSVFTVNQQGESSPPATIRLAVREKVGFFQGVRIWMVALAGLLLVFIFKAYQRYHAAG